MVVRIYFRPSKVATSDGVCIQFKVVADLLIFSQNNAYVVNAILDGHKVHR